MTEDHPAPGPEEGPEQERVRALLAGLGSPATGETMPPEVVARLERTLEGLVAERGDTVGTREGSATVVPLRTRWLPRAAVAAAAVVVLGTVGVASGAFRALVDSTGSTTSSDAGAASEPRTASLPPSPAQGLQGQSGSSADKSAALPAVSVATFGADVQRLLSGQEVRAPAGSGAPSPSTESQSSRVGCVGPRVTDGATVTPITLDGRPAVLVVHPARGGHRLAQAWSCSGTTRLASAQVAP